jgi:hypothetical protein
MTTRFGTSRILVAVTALVMAFSTIPSNSGLAAQQSGGLSPQVVAQMNALMDEKVSRTPAQRKMDSQLVYAAKMARGEPIASNVAALRIDLADVNERGVVLDVRADVSDRLLDQMRALGAEVLDVSATYRNIRIRAGVGQIEAIAALPGVTYVQPKHEPVTSRTGMVAPQTTRAAPLNIRGLRMQKRIERADVISSVRRTVAGGDPVNSVGSKSSEGDVTHRATGARTTYGVSGAGVRIGVLSDGVAGLASSQASGDLGSVAILDGRCTVGTNSTTCAEGTAMLEIIHDLAPGAELYFATGVGGTAVFAQNIRNLQAAGCTIIVDDLTYAEESPFQDGQVGTSATNGGIVTQAVKDVTAAGVLYFSSATNSGNKNDNTSGTWEGDFVDGGTPTGPLAGRPGRVHNFGGQTYNQLLIDSIQAVALFWSDPLGASANDYDLFILNSAGTSIVNSSTNYQTGTQDPYEQIIGSSAGQRVVIIKFSGNARFLHLDSGRNRFQISTAGAMHGHAATTAPNSFGVAATPAATAYQLTPAHVGPYPAAFNGSNTIEGFSSDGPRRIFFAGNGSPLTPGNFSATGGQVLQKPDFTAADGVSISAAAGFSSPFYGTSAAAPHAAAIAALVKSRNLAQTASQVRAALFSSAIDIEGPGIDRDSGVGIIMADTAVAAVIGAGPTISTKHDADGDGKADLAIFRPSNGTWYTRYSAQGYSTATAVQWGLPGDIPISGDFDGDGQIELTIFRPSNGTWYVRYSSIGYSLGTVGTFQWGLQGDIPIAADFDGDRKTDLAIWRPSTGSWYIRYSAQGFAVGTSGFFQWGLTGDVPLSADFDGDGRADLAVWRPANGTWYVRFSTQGYAVATAAAVQWGLRGDLPIAGDFDGDGTTDLAIWRPANGTWYIRYSSLGFVGFNAFQWGLAGDVPIAADFDGDGKTELAIWRPANGTWYIRYSSLGFVGFNAFQWGLAGDAVVK